MRARPKGAFIAETQRASTCNALKLPVMKKIEQNHMRAFTVMAGLKAMGAAALTQKSVLCYSAVASTYAMDGWKTPTCFRLFIVAVACLVFLLVWEALQGFMPYNEAKADTAQQIQQKEQAGKADKKKKE